MTTTGSVLAEQDPGEFATRARAVVDAAVGRYITQRRARVPAFTDRHFNFAGALRLHRRALGWDLVRAPANVALAVPQIALFGLGWAATRLRARRTADWLTSRQLMLVTDVADEIQWLLYTELLELPIELKRRGGRRVSEVDSLWTEIFRDPRVDEVIAPYLAAIGKRGDDPAFRDRLTDTLKVYVGSRTAAAEIATAFVSAGVGAISAKQLTPSALTLGPALAALLAKHAAVASFPLGAGLGGVWYGLFPASVTTTMVVSTTAAVFAAGAVATAFAGVIADPVQRRFGIHQKRLNRIIDNIENDLTGGAPGRFAVRDHYVARLIDAIDIIRSAARLAT